MQKFDRVSGKQDLPIRIFLAAGIPITINTDDPSIEGTDLQTEWNKVIKAFALDKAEVLQLMLNSVNAAFCSEDVRKELEAEIETEYR